MNILLAICIVTVDICGRSLLGYNTKSIEYIYIYMGNGQYLVYSSKSSIFEECIIVFFRCWEDSKCYCFFEECIIVFQAPA